MNDADLIRRLASLKSVAPDATWVSKNREVLSCQISNGADYGKLKLGFFANVSLFSRRLMQPAPIAALIAVFFMVSGAVGLNASRQSTPGDPLYIAKQLHEKAQLATTFNEKEKAKLYLEFATQRAAEIDVIAKAENSENDPRLERLSENFNRELSSARETIKDITEAAVSASANVETPEETPETVAKTTPAETKQPVTETVKPATEGEGNVVMAESGKEETKIKVIIPADEAKKLDEVQKLFDSKDYNGAIDKLKEISIQTQ